MKKQKRPLKERIRIFKLRFKNNWLYNEIVGGWYHIVRLWCFASSKRKAKRWSRKTNGRRYYVVPIDNYHFRIMCNIDRKAYNRRVARRFRINFMKLDGVAYWNTDMKKKPKTKKS